MTDGEFVPEVLEFWFGAPDDPDFDDRNEQWFTPKPHFDAEIRDRFLDAHERAAAGELDGLMSSADGCLALIILLDQFPRNLFRGSARAFATDPKARDVARHAIGAGFDQGLSPARRMFMYLPFEHSEDAADQERSVALFLQLGNDFWTKYAVQHRDIVTRFGRFPHRNAVLGRESTPEELEFLEDPSMSFGQSTETPE